MCLDMMGVRIVGRGPIPRTFPRWKNLFNEPSSNYLQTSNVTSVSLSFQFILILPNPNFRRGNLSPSGQVGRSKIVNSRNSFTKEDESRKFLTRRDVLLNTESIRFKENPLLTSVQQ